MRRKSAWEFGLCLALCLGWAAVVWSAPEKDALTLRVDIDNDAVLRGIATVTAIADSESETELVAKVEFKVNDALRATDTSVPYVFRWDTLEGADGNYRLEVTATDTAGKSASRSFKVRVDNAEGKTAADHAILALQALEKKDYAGAALSARKALRLEPGQPQASGLYARALLAQGSLEKAASVLEDGLKIHPDSSDLSLLLASAHARRGLEAAKSLDDYRDALKTAQSQKRMALGRLIRKAGADEKDARAQAELGAIYLEQRDLAAAARALAEANELDPARDDIVLSLAMVCWYRGKMRDARYILQGAVRAGQDSAQVRAGLSSRPGKASRRKARPRNSGRYWPTPSC